MNKPTLQLKNNFQATLTPEEIVKELDKHIIGQAEAKRAVAIAMRNRWRRSQVKEDLRVEITPKNILMIGPTGVGKTEIARRLAKLAQAPFIKVEATKFTEVGYVGRDVESIIRDLTDVAVKQTREMAMAKVKDRAREAALERVLDALLPPTHPTPRSPLVATAVPVKSEEIKVSTLTEDLKRFEEFVASAAPKPEEAKPTLPEIEVKTRDVFRQKVLDGSLDDKMIEVDAHATIMGVEIMAPPGMEEMTSQLQSIFTSLSGSRTKKKKMKVKDALKQLTEDEASNLVNEEDVKNLALEGIEQHGIVFIDEIDKIVERTNTSGPSREGVQRDLLPLIEGSTVFTKYGMVKTDHILFIASGAFQIAKPSELIPELQGRLPIRVELKALTADDFEKILTEPKASLTEQYQELMRTEGLEIEFMKSGIRRIAEIAYQVNERTENIGARRLHTIMERLLEEISFHAPRLGKEKSKININTKYVNERLTKFVEDEDLSRSIL